MLLVELIEISTIQQKINLINSSFLGHQAPSIFSGKYWTYAIVTAQEGESLYFTIPYKESIEVRKIVTLVACRNCIVYKH